MRYINCPNCGAPVEGFQCKYCGTILQEEREKFQTIADEIHKLMLEDSLINARQQLISKQCRHCRYWNEYPASRGKSDGPRGKCIDLQKETAFYDSCSKGRD